MAFERVSKNPIYGQVADQLRDAIVAGQLEPGQELPAERVLAESFGASRTSVREALRSLEAQGLIVSGGAPLRSVVAPELGPARREALVSLLRLNQVELADLVEFRCVLESAAARWAARSPERDYLEEARAALSDMRHEEITVESFDDADMRFHAALVRASGNEAMHLVMAALREPVYRHILQALRARRNRSATLNQLADEHRQILSAVEGGDGERAAQLLESHIRGFYSIGGAGSGAARS